MSIKKQKHMMTQPTATYSSPTISKEFNTADHPDSHHTTNGRTTGPSQFVLDAGAVDKDMPTEAKDTYLGRLRAQVTTLQDDLNEFLTERMKAEADDKLAREKQEEFEKILLDGDDEDSDDD